MSAFSGVTLRLHVILLVLSIIVYHCEGFLIDCHGLCHTERHNPHTNKTALLECNCPGVVDSKGDTHHSTSNQSTERTSTISTTLKTLLTSAARTQTQSVCDYLCSIQEGGSACDCSQSIVPGK